MTCALLVGNRCRRTPHAVWHGLPSPDGGTSIAVYGAHEAHTAVPPWIDGFFVDIPVHGCFRRLLHEGVDFGEISRGLTRCVWHRIED
jgi:hypothetical protein